MKRLIPLLLAAAALLAPAVSLADTTVATDPQAQELTALDGTRVWVSGAFGSQTLKMQTGSGPVTPVPGEVVAKAYQSVDLGHDSSGQLVLTYLRCLTSLNRCNPMRDDLQGHRATVRGLAPAGCSVSTAPAIWRTRVVYGVGCARSAKGGLYTRSGSGSPRRLPIPRDAKRYGSTQITWADVRGSRVGAVAADIYAYAFSETVGGRELRSFLAAASEGDSDERVAGLSLGAGGDLWALTDAEHAGDPNLAVIYRQHGTCLQYEQLANPAGPHQEEGYLATGLAVDGTNVFLTTPDGIAQHPFTPNRACS